MNDHFQGPTHEKCQVQCGLFLGFGSWEVESEKKPLYEDTGNVLPQRHRTIP